MTDDKSLIPVERIQQAILLLRGQKVMLDADLARLYGVSTKALNQAVKRNKDRFPADFMFRLSAEEKSEVVTSCDHLARPKFSSALPRAFTEHGAVMLASVLNSSRAIAVSICVVRAFVQLQQTLAAHAQLAKRLHDLECPVQSHDERIHSLFEAIHQLIAPPEPKRRPIGFRPGGK